MARRRRGRRRRGAGAAILTAAAVAAVLGAHAVLGIVAAAFLAGMITGATTVLAVARPRLALRVSTRGTRARTLGEQAPSRRREGQKRPGGTWTTTRGTRSAGTGE
jgi:hypothetical protein